MYGNTAAQPLGTAAYGTVKFQYSDVQNGIYTDTKPSKPGTYYMKARVDGTADYPVLLSEAVGFKITKGEVSVIADDITGTKGDAVKELTYIQSGNTASGDQFDVSLSTTAYLNSEAGDYPITVSVAYDDALYNVTKVDGTYHITRTDITIAADGVNVPYDGKAHGISVNAVSDGTAQQVYYSETKITDTSNLASNSDAKTVSPTRNHPCSLQVYYYVICGSEVFGGSKMLTITKAPLTVAAKDAAVNEGEEPKNDGVSYSGLAGGDTEKSLNGAVQYSYTYSKGMADGSYEIRPSGLSSIDYGITYKSGTLTVNPVQQETAISGTGVENGVYDAKPHKGYSGTPVALGGEMTEKDFTIVYKDTAGNAISGAPTDAGSYSVTISVPESDKHYKGSVTYNFDIAKKTVIIRAQDQSMIAGQEFSPMDPVYSGFEGSDDESSAIKTKATVVLGPGANTSQAGSVAINVTGNGEFTASASANYVFGTPENAKLTILAKAPGGKGGDGTGSVSMDAGVIQTAVITEPGLPKTELEPDLTADTAKKLLSAEEVDEVKKGEDALIYLVMSDAGDDDASDKELISDNALKLDSGMVIGMYFDLSMFKKVGNEAPDKVSVAGTKTTIKIALPDDLKSDDATKTRTYYIVYVHDGVSKVIYPEYVDGVLTFDASEFSTYSIVYADTEKKSDGGGSSGSSDIRNSGSSDTENSGSGNTDNTGAESSGTGNPRVVVPAATVQKPAVTTPPVTVPDTPVTAPKAENTTGKTGAGKGKAVTVSKEAGAGSSKNTEDKGSKPADKTPEKPVPATPQAQIPDHVATETEQRLSDALKAVRKLDPEIMAGPYVQVPEDQRTSVNKDGTVTFTVDVPKDLQAKSRTFYLMAVDKNGNVHVLKNESLENGKITVTGDPDMTYQIIYEDNSTALAGMISGNGTLEGANGSVVTVSTNHCFWHWIILVLGVFGAVLEIVFRKKKKVVLTVLPLDPALMLLCLLLGWCLWDIPALAIGLVLILFGFIQGQKMVRQEKENDS